ncbi:hypothetical protein [Chryseobacterium sp. R2ACT005]|uniref:hypothetical protein n=1 Tax=Chryseobacterium sp. R2ACT005 TaxID=3416668 RepID=UPI003CE73C1B
MKKFIPVLVIPILALLNSCSNDDDYIFINNNNQKETENALLKNKNLGNINQFDFKTIAKDSIFKENTQQDAAPEQNEGDPPVKNGDHWIYGN